LPSFDSYVPESWKKMHPQARPPQCELFGARLSELLNPEHPLYVLAERIDWSQFDAAIDASYADELGRPGVNTRLMVGLLYLKHAFDESDESVVARWVRTRTGSSSAASAPCSTSCRSIRRA